MRAGKDYCDTLRQTIILKKRLPLFKTWMSNITVSQTNLSV